MTFQRKITSNIDGVYKSVPVREKGQIRKSGDKTFILKINGRVMNDREEFKGKLNKVLNKKKGTVEISYETDDSHHSWTRTYKLTENSLLETYQDIKIMYEDLGEGILRDISKDRFRKYNYPILKPSGISVIKMDHVPPSDSGNLNA